jgi:malonate transporter and related proteins
MTIAALVLPVFAVILSGWIAGASGYLPRSLSGPLVQFAYNVAMPALVFLTIAEERLEALLEWGFIAAFGGGSMLCFGVVYAAARFWWRRDGGASALIGASAAMTNTGFVALPVLQALYGARGVLAAAVATVLVAVLMFPPLIAMLERDRDITSGRRGACILVRMILVNPLIISTVLGLGWSLSGLPLPAPLRDFIRIFGDSLTGCALFSIGLGFSLSGLRHDWRASLALSLVKLVVVPGVVWLVALACGLSKFNTLAAVICAGVPTAKTAYVLAGEFNVEHDLVAATVSVTTLLSVVSLLAWLYALQ